MGELPSEVRLSGCTTAFLQPLTFRQIRNRPRIRIRDVSALRIKLTALPPWESTTGILSGLASLAGFPGESNLSSLPCPQKLLDRSCAIRRSFVSRFCRDIPGGCETSPVWPFLPDGFREHRRGTRPHFYPPAAILGGKGGEGMKGNNNGRGKFPLYRQQHHRRIHP